MYDYNNKINEKQRLKSKKQIQRGVQFSSSLLHFHGAPKPPDPSVASPHVLTTSQNPSHWNPSWLSDACATRKDPESE